MGSTCTKLLVCTKGKHCAARDSQDVLTFLRKTVEKAQLDNLYKVKKSDCLGHCKHGPVVVVNPLGLSYGGVTEIDCIDILQRHVAKKKPIKRLLIKSGKHK